MVNDTKSEKRSNTLTIDGVTFKTSGNITFPESEETHFCIAHSAILDEMNAALENGMHSLMKKCKG